MSIKTRIHEDVIFGNFTYGKKKHNLKFKKLR